MILNTYTSTSSVYNSQRIYGSGARPTNRRSLPILSTRKFLVLRDRVSGDVAEQSKCPSEHDRRVSRHCRPTPVPLCWKSPKTFEYEEVLSPPRSVCTSGLGGRVDSFSSTRPSRRSRLHPSYTSAEGRPSLVVPVEPGVATATVSPNSRQVVVAPRPDHGFSGQFLNLKHSTN